MRVKVEYQNGRRHGQEEFTGSRREVLDAVETLEQSGYEIDALLEVEDKKPGFLGRITGSLSGQARERRSR